ncbi:hypothetical protein CRI77_05045 [Mycolicibacterium duvalii]|uniref:Uncharacterized protein n=1 Tax=Mycolicibacterium duvalii TaxID=39688 RepID=A0A7I7JZX5_9MYCO|nr:hypothetical protein [Mycolicibacterium duvalii]MCV7367307.1 hypothetical protein [Mycolicibacterium duvalii]PEG43650.1 hypothetical protein CRI77_05045 [Mycolicibacterium duvalii]BBX17323.1 hypothetical protein MDUV_21830 [Mycolicibacterium duvalii]
MPGIAEIALAGAPVAGGALLGLAAGNLRGPDIRGTIAKDMDLLQRLPEDQVARRAELQRVIDLRIDGLIAGIDKNRELRELAMSYRGNWRDVVVFLCAILFTIVWWNVDHDRTNWLVMFIVMIMLSVLAGVYAARGIAGGLSGYLRARRSR